MALRVPVAGTVTFDKGDIMKAIYEPMYATRQYKKRYNRRLKRSEFEFCPSRKRHVKGWI